MLKKFLTWGAFALSCTLGGAQPVTLRFANFIPAKVGYSPAFQELADTVTKDSGGALKVDVYHGGTLGSNSAQQLKLLEDGVAQIAFFVPSYTAGRFPELEVTELPLLVETSREGSIALNHMLQKGGIPSLKGFKILGITTTHRTTLHTRTPVRKMDDLRGARIRVAGALTSEVVKTLGGTPIQMGGGEVLDGLSRGVIDGLVGESYFVGSYKMEEVAKAHLNNSIGAITLVVAMLESEFNKLPAAGKAALEKQIGLPFSLRWAEVMDKGNGDMLTRFRQRGDNVLLDLDAAELGRWQTAMRPVIGSWVARRPQNEKTLADFRQELEAARSAK